jgi:hypothetical protein
MAYTPIVLTNAFVSIDGTDFSDHVTSVTLNQNVDAVETTAMSAAGARTRVGGLKDNSVTIEFNQDFSTAELEATVNAVGTSWVGQNDISVIVKPDGSTTSATNPSYTFDVLVSEWTPLNGAVGELATVSVTWPVNGDITKSVTP